METTTFRTSPKESITCKTDKILLKPSGLLNYIIKAKNIPDEFITFPTLYFTTTSLTNIQPTFIFENVQLFKKINVIKRKKTFYSTSWLWSSIINTKLTEYSKNNTTSLAI